MRNSVLYYPHIEIQDKGWLKSALLLWDHVYRIVPKSYTPKDDIEIQKAVDAGLIRSISLENDDIIGCTSDFQNFIDNLSFLPAGLDYERTSYLHLEKIDSHLYPLLDQYSTGNPFDGWIELPQDIARGYMFFLSNKVAARRNLARATDDKYSYAIAPFFSENANFDEFTCDKDADGFYSSLIINDFFPHDISTIPIERIIEIIRHSQDERKAFREELFRFAEELHKCSSKEHAETIFHDYKNELLQRKKNLKAAQGFLNNNDVGSLFSMGLPVSLSAYGAIAASGQDPFGLLTLASSVFIGAIASYFDYKKATSLKDNPSGASYLISLEKDFSECKQIPAFDRYFEEFIND